MMSLPSTSSWGRILLLASCLSTGGCATVARQDYFAVAGNADRTESNYQGEMIHSTLKPDVAILEREGVNFRVTVDQRGESPILFGFIVPAVPVFFIPGIAKRLRTDRLVLLIDVGGIISADRPVQIRFDDVGLRSISLEKQEAPTRIMGVRGLGRVECQDRKVNLPLDDYKANGIAHSKFQSAYTFWLEWGPGLPELDSFELYLDGVTVGNTAPEPVRVAFSRRRGWFWAISSMQ